MSSGDIIETPKVVYEQLGNVAPTCQVDILRENEKSQIRFTVGLLETTRPSYEPPTTTFDSSLLFSFVDAVVAEDDTKVCGVATKIYDYELDVNHHAKLRVPLSKSESNVEHCFLNDGVSLQEMANELKVSDVVLLNPSKGTMKRVKQHQSCVPQVVVLPKIHADQRRDLKLMCDEFKWKYFEKTTNQLSFDALYYLSFNASLGSKLGIPHYVGFEPNPLQLALRGDMQEMVRGNRYDEYVYYRYTEERRLRYFVSSKNRHNIYPSDYLFEKYRYKREFRYNQPFMHDLYSSENIYSDVAKVMKAIVMPYNCRFVIGSEYTHDKKGILDKDNKYVLYTGNRSWSTRQIPRCAMTMSDVGLGFQRASYVINMYGASIIFLGRKRFLKRCNTESQAFMEAKREYEAGRSSDDWRGKKVPRSLVRKNIDNLVESQGYYYYDVSPQSAEVIVVQKAGGKYRSGHRVYSEVKYQELPRDISQIFGSETFCTTTYQTIVGVKLLYVRQDDDDVMADIIDSTELL